MFKKAAQQLNLRQNYPEVDAHCCPNMAEAAFNKIVGFEPHYHYAVTDKEKGPLEAVMNEVEEQIKRLEALGDKYKTKAAACQAAYDQWKEDHKDAKPDKFGVEARKQAIKLCDKMMPEFSKHVGVGAGKTKSAKALMNAANRYFIYKRDIVLDKNEGENMVQSLTERCEVKQADSLTAPSGSAHGRGRSESQAMR